MPWLATGRGLLSIVAVVVGDLAFDLMLDNVLVSWGGIPCLSYCSSSLIEVNRVVPGSIPLEIAYV